MINSIGVKHQIIESTFDLLRLIAQDRYGIADDDMDDLLSVQMEVFEEWLDVPIDRMLCFEIWSEKRTKRRTDE